MTPPGPLHRRGPLVQVRGGAGNGKVGELRYVASQRFQRFAYRASAGFSRADKWSLDFANDRADYQSQLPDAKLGLRSMRANGVVQAPPMRAKRAPPRARGRVRSRARRRRIAARCRQG